MSLGFYDEASLTKILQIVAVCSLLASAAAQEHQKPDAASRSTPVLDGAVKLWTDPGLWTPVLAGRDDTLIFIHRDGGAHGRMIFKADGKSSKAQVQEILERVKKVSLEAKFIFQETRTVNGRELECFQIEAPRPSANSMVYYGCAYGDEKVSVQSFGIVERPELASYYLAITDFLNGLEIRPGS